MAAAVWRWYTTWPSVSGKCAAADTDLAAQWWYHVKPITTHYTPNDISIWLKWHFFIMYNQRRFWHYREKSARKEKDIEWWFYRGHPNVSSKKSQLLVWTGSHTAHVKITIRGTPNCPNYCVIFCNTCNLQIWPHFSKHHQLQAVTSCCKKQTRMLLQKT